MLNFEAGVLLPANSGIKKVIGIQLPITPSEKHSSSILLLNPITRKQAQAPLYAQLDKLENATHVMCGTGGSMVPKEIIEDYYKKYFFLLVIQKEMLFYFRNLVNGHL
ncbi:hypothetical protein [Bacillus pseudomycoides]|uniref:hypothetical protein n=1 Tax=Bacillus pseudomycoides TaxID=64104 RepID=UPI0005355E5D|nr:hypothetical protein [Bacillus pseudomycoides]OOR49642.1 hypothetical protein BLX05_23155 [Bacillus pseudomycoides]PEU49630.1 hypothetical protein CN535_00350 [Bacillus pseudomycoides]PFY12451.1 hypothetical protein COL42_23630 [Bacillus pseudomycoides]PGA66522.1 hypothetical protein COL89_26220 [Bacillus pseudomycoides]